MTHTESDFEPDDLMTFDLARYPYGFFCDECGEPATTLRRVFFAPAIAAGWEPRWVIAMGCDEHAEETIALTESRRSTEAAHHV